MKKIAAAVFVGLMGVVLLSLFFAKEPTITFELEGENEVRVKQDRPYIESGFSAKDSQGVELNNYVTISGWDYDTNNIGEYTIIYTLEYEEEIKNLERTVIVTPALTKDMAYNFFKNVDLNVMQFFPESFRFSTEPNETITSNCIANENNKYDYDVAEYDYCISKLDQNMPMSNTYIDIYSSMKQFELVEKYTNTILHSMDTVSNVTQIDGASVVTPYGKIGMSITDDTTDDSITFQGEFSYTNVTEISLDITSELTYDYEKELYYVRYGYDISVGYAFFGVTFYHMYAEAYIDSNYNLQSMDIYTNIPTVRTKATSLHIVDNATVEMTSYYSVVGLYESKAYIYSNDEFGYAYKINDALGLSPKTYFDVFTQETMILSYEEKGENSQAKHYFTGLNGWTEVYYLIDVLGPNNKLDSVIVFDDMSSYYITEEEFDNNESIGFLVEREKPKYFYYSNETDDIEEYTYPIDTFYLLSDSSKGSANVFDLPYNLTSIITLNTAVTYNDLINRMENFEVLGVLIFDIAGFDFEIPIETD